MNPIEHNLLPKQRKQKRNLNVKIDLYNYTQELYKELASKNVIDRIKEVPQLGPIRVKRKLSKSRYDYTILQLYLHKIIRKNLNSELEISYNNKINLEDFMQSAIEVNKTDRPTIGDLLQLLTIVYNIGHFYNTFTSSRAVIIYANENEEFADKLIKSSKDERFKNNAKIYIEDRNYHRLHLLNSILVLERCNQELNSIKIAQEVLYAYINKEDLPVDNKLHYIFDIFKKVRDVSYIAYDLQISNTPLTIDLCNKDALVLILKEFLSFYNNQKPTEELFKSIGKLLDDTIYNENSNAICYYQISRKMTRKIDLGCLDSYYSLWKDKNSILNFDHGQRRDYSEETILKLTFDPQDKYIAQELLFNLERTNNVRVGYYDRYSGEKTILVSIKKGSFNKIVTAFRVLKLTIKHLRKLESYSPNNTRFLLTTKFFLYYLFSENDIVLRNTVDENICVICTRGKISRINELNNILKKNLGTADERYEVEFIINCLVEDNKNDISITIPSSILVLEKDKQVKKLCEFDGMIIHPNRETNQIILLEAKNTSKSPSYAKKCLSEKLDKLNFNYNKDEIITKGFNAMLEISI